MRQVVLVIVLVAAAFLGGAFVNGPGLRWAQTQLLGSLGLNDEGEIASVDLKGAVSPGATGEGSQAAKAGSEPVTGPLAPVPSLVTETDPGKTDASGSRSSRAAGDERRPASPGSSPPPPLTAPLGSSQSGPGSSKGIAGTEEKSLSAFPDTDPPALLDPSVNRAVTSTPGGQPPPDRDGAPAPPAPRGRAGLHDALRRPAAAGFTIGCRRCGTRSVAASRA